MYVNQGIKYINFSGCKLGDEGAIILGRALSGNELCEVYSWSLFYSFDLLPSSSFMSDLGSAKCLNFSYSLHCYVKLLQHLDISHNNLYSGCGDSIGDILSKTRIKVLNLEWNELYLDKCVEKIFEGVKKSQYIKEINYSWNGLSGTGWVKSFKQSLIKNGTLEILRMDNNRFDRAHILLSKVKRSSFRSFS